MNLRSNLAKSAALLVFLMLTGLLAAPAVLASSHTMSAQMDTMQQEMEQEMAEEMQGLQTNMDQMQEDLQNLNENEDETNEASEAEQAEELVEEESADEATEEEQAEETDLNGDATATQSQYYTGKKKFKKFKKQPAPRGSITVCKLIVDENNSAIRGTSVPGITFSTEVDGTSVDEEDVSFTTPLTLNSDLNDNNVSDSRCHTLDDLRLGTYTYTEEDVSGDDDDRISVRGYNDQFVVGSSGLSSFEDFDTSSSSDGEIVLTRNNADRTLVMLNELLPEEEEQAEEPERKKPKYFFKKKFVPPTVDEGEQAEEEELPEEEELAEEEEAPSDADCDQLANSNEEQEAAAEATNGSDASIDQEANTNIEQECLVESTSGGSATVNQEANSNIQQDADISAE